MNPLKLRRTLTTLHLWLAGLLAPAFLVVAISGALHIAGIGEHVEKQPLVIPAGTELNIGAPEFEGQVRTLIKDMDLGVRFEYIRGRGNAAMTRPTTRTYLSFAKTEDGVTAEINKPNFAASLMELHKGHGPRVYRFYQMIVGVILLLVVVGGIAVGLLAKTYRNQTLIAAAIGTIFTIGLAIF